MRKHATQPTLSVPFLGISATWEPSTAEADAAWELLVEISTRVSTTALNDEHGSDWAIMASLHSLFDTTRRILRSHGKQTARDPRNGNLSLAAIATRMLNEIRPFLTAWHGRGR